MTHCAEGVALSGVVHHTLVAGNRILETEFGAIDFLDPLRGTLGVTIVNNTLYRNLNKGLQILDDHDKGEAFLECKQVRFQSNLILEHGDAVDQILLNRKRGVFFGNAAPGDLKSLLQSPEWQFGFNWHEAARPVPSSLNVGNAIPPVPDDHYKRVIKAGSRNPNDPSFLRPPKDSPLATGGAGAKPGPNDLPLPAYVGAVPPEGVEPWDWDKTWKAMVDDPRVLTVSKRLADKARFNTIAAALDAAEEGMTVRVIDDAVYDECLLVTARHRGFTLEGIANATLRCLPDKTDTLIIRDAPHVTVRGLRFTTSDRPDHKTGGDLIHIAGQCVGLLLDRLDMAGDKAGDGKPTPFIDLYSGTGTKDDPIRIQGCTFRECLFSEILVEGSARNDLDQPLPCGYLIIRDNVFTRCGAGITTRGATHHVLVAANRFHETRSGAVDVLAPLLGMADAFFVNNTMFRNSDRAFGVWQHRENQAFSLCKNIRFQYNLILQHAPQYDMYLLKYKPPDFTNTTPGDVESLLTSPGWHFGFNWHEASRPDPNSPDMGAIPPIPEEHYEPVINVLSWNPDDPNFLRPPKDSPLATAGAGAKPGPNDPPLPAYVGAVPPEGVEPWDWEKTWRAMVR